MTTNSKPTNSKIKINIKSLLEFFDEKSFDNAPVNKQATAIVAVSGEDLGAGLLHHYFSGIGCTVEVLNDPCTKGTKKGKRLDRWIKVSRNKKTILYQVEIKNWSAHAINGKKLALKASPKDVKFYKIERWENVWDAKSCTFSKENVKKVFEEQMEPPKRLKDIKPIRPLACFWDAMHPSGSEKAFFSENHCCPDV